jgi:hypothetical protein
MLPARFFKLSPGELRFLRIRSILYMLRFAIIGSVLLVLVTYGVIHP